MICFRHFTVFGVSSIASDSKKPYVASFTKIEQYNWLIQSIRKNYILFLNELNEDESSTNLEPFSQYALVNLKSTISRTGKIDTCKKRQKWRRIFLPRLYFWKFKSSTVLVLDVPCLCLHLHHLNTFCTFRFLSEHNTTIIHETGEGRLGDSHTTWMGANERRRMEAEIQKSIPWAMKVRETVHNLVLKPRARPKHWTWARCVPWLGMHEPIVAQRNVDEQDQT